MKLLGILLGMNKMLQEQGTTYCPCESEWVCQRKFTEKRTFELEDQRNVFLERGASMCTRLEV